MRPSASFLSQPVRSLQTMLRTIAASGARIPSVVPDGIYGPQTISAVSAFQRSHDLPVTGITNYETWKAISAQYRRTLVGQQQAQSIPIVLNPHQVIRLGTFHRNLYLAQAMLTVLSQEYSAIPAPEFTGILDSASQASIEAFQRLSALPATGELDKMTWKHLALQYALNANLSKHREQA